VKDEEKYRPVLRPPGQRGVLGGELRGEQFRMGGQGMMSCWRTLVGPVIGSVVSKKQKSVHATSNKDSPGATSA
jgi:hypothetical protein